jgi:hypothetical protein
MGVVADGVMGPMVGFGAGIGARGGADAAGGKDGAGGEVGAGGGSVSVGNANAPVPTDNTRTPDSAATSLVMGQMFGRTAKRL